MPTMSTHPEQMTDVVTELFWPGILSLVLPVVGTGITTTTTENSGKPGDGSSGCKHKDSSWGP